ncbi:MAG TPA: ABC transporter permease subunit [Spirochaetes bacterium]|nr:ABC transporter permease subunit [Spirochaetota bacterium]
MHEKKTAGEDRWKVNLVHLLLPIPIWLRYNKGYPVKVIAWNHTNGSALTVGPRSNIQSFADLGKKQIAVPYWYSMHNVILQLGLRKHGLKPVIKPQNAKLAVDEVNLFILPPPEMPVALAGNKIDGYIVAEPFNALAEEKLKAKIMRFTGDIWKSHPCCTVVMNTNPDWIKMAKNQGASDSQLLFKVVFPASVPYIITGVRLSLGVAWIILVPAEMLGTSSGLGYLINDARDTMSYDNLMAVVIAIGIIGFCIDSLFQVIKRKFEWKPRKNMFMG